MVNDRVDRTKNFDHKNLPWLLDIVQNSLTNLLTNCSSKLLDCLFEALFDHIKLHLDILISFWSCFYRSYESDFAISLLAALKLSIFINVLHIGYVILPSSFYMIRFPITTTNATRSKPHPYFEQWMLTKRLITVITLWVL